VQPLTVDDVRQFLAPLGIEVQELPADTSTAPSAAAALGTSVPTIVKSLLFRTGDDWTLALVAGDRRLDGRSLARELQSGTVRLAKPEEVVEVAGYPVGGVPPVAHRRQLRTVLDRHLLEHPVVWAAAGNYNAVFPIEPRRLQEITNANVTDATT
jgi:prolyl-tRNA editing enzyme YbaK/EbsC (Cys-tRNA(Pro) deacylase)